MKPPRTLIGEAVLLAAMTFAIALVANALHPKGLDLGRNYFPADQVEDVENGEPAQGLQHDFAVLSLADVKDYQPYAAGEDAYYLILDARSEKDYKVGHIPGARLCHHYHQDLYVPNLLSQMNAVDLIIIYCAGGDCEDSIQLATDLVYTHGVPKELVTIFEGGWEEWEEAGLEIKEGEQP